MLHMFSGITWDEAEVKFGEKRLKEMQAKGSCTVVQHNGVDMVCFQRLKVGKKEVVKDTQQQDKSKIVDKGTFEKLSSMFETLGWSVVGGGASGSKAVSTTYRNRRS